MADDTTIMIVAGEASADLHGAKLVEAMRAARGNVSAWGVGGPAMRAVGFETVCDAEAISVAGLTEVLFAIPRIWLIMRRLKRLVAERRPAAVVLIDLPDFNLRLAKRIKKLGIPIIYYISPQVWAWRQSRVEQIRELVAHMLVILPFEQSFYEKHGVPATFVGHPLVEILPEQPDPHAAREALGIANLTNHQGPVLALLPGSRHKEVTRHLPVMLRAARLLKERFPDLLAVLPVASTIRRQLIDRLITAHQVEVTVVDEQSTEVLSAADAAIVCSGTSTLQAALLSRPMVVVYKVSWLTYQILKRLVKVTHIALVNLIAGKELVKELVQRDFTAEAVAREVGRLLADPEERSRVAGELTELRRQLGRGGTAKRVAEVVLGCLEPAKPALAAPGPEETDG